jgi:hypothetical protein
MRSLLFILFICFVAHPVRATTWDEPWHDEVMRNSESFVKVRVTANRGSVAEAEVIKFLAGARTPEQIELRGYWRLTLMSTSSSSDDELRLPFTRGQIYYLFIKKSEKTSTYQIPTPTSGWAQLQGADVAATYRHSFHKALVPEEVYEKTMPAIFNGAKGQPYDSDFIERFIKEQLTQSVAVLKSGRRRQEKILPPARCLGNLLPSGQKS